ncbi:MAG: carbon-nitrogen hydrolase family protein [Gallionella sp.]|nr:carbon-nitrogen hydrolase family protein [Gallionella sp.]OIO11919.1 MAG: acyltransferase [Gallionellaceae bacterium CG1_02_60_325]PIR09823.1 MAG: acyltransferase [Gallionellaceae bacterium CG11_big_fil_rev_8_21_14_0_20_60_62]PIV47565.1 MAG: acyltransferase [Gallionellaceae bacterium CG02_land_8_20_14_3_00_60_115]PJC05290.1 MAG: acyltransferase [Gallionellaceae bacterium CG_4_9_14_0_8_um_filter_60_335]
MTPLSIDSTQSRIAAQQSAFKVAAVQMASGPRVEGNLNEARRLIADAAAKGAKLVVLPEFFAIMGMDETDKVKVCETPGEGVIQQFMREQARRHKIWLIGSLPLQATAPDKVRNSLLVFDESGTQVARYDKIHLFNLTLGNESYNEAQTIEAGDKVVVVDSPFGRIGLAICYDLRFPELFRTMPDVDLIVLPAAFTATTGKVHWEPLVRARAIENLSYVIAAAQGGYHVNGRETHGHSMIVDPWGRILDELPRGSGVVMAEINASYQKSLRASLPALSHRNITCNCCDQA